MTRAQPIDQFMTHFSASLADGTFVRATLSRPLHGASAQKVIARAIDLKGKPHLSVTLRFPTRDETKNFPIAAGVDWVRTQIESRFASAVLGTTRRDWQLFAPKKSPARLVAHEASTKQAPSRSHDRKRRGMLDDSANDWLRALGVVDPSGKPRVEMADKFRQIDRYLEIFSHLAADCGWVIACGDAKADAARAREEFESADPNRSGAGLQNREHVLTIADMGSGKGYLTFGLWHLFRRVWRIPVRVIGIETRDELAVSAEQLAREIGADGLEFRSGTIASATFEHADALIALHACNTATDDAIRRGIQLEAKLIVVAPCCHKELRPQFSSPDPLAPILRHGIMEERMAEWVTDGLRALYLDWSGYRTKLFEFVSSEHTPKNLMIAAVRNGAAFVSAEARARIERLKAFFGIDHHALDVLLDTPEAKAVGGKLAESEACRLEGRSGK